MPRYRTKGIFQVGEFWVDWRGPALYKFWYDKRLKRVRRQSLGTADVPAAKEALAQWYLQTRRPQNAKPEDVILGAVLMNYYADHAQHIASAEQARIACEHLQRFFQGSSVGSLTIDRQEAYITERRKAVSDGTISRELSVVRAAVNRAFKRGELQNYPHVINLARGPARERRLSLSELSNLYRAADEHVRMFIEISGSTLGRPGAVLDLQLFQCDFENRLIHLNPLGRKQTKKYRPTVPMVNMLLPILRAAKGPHVIQYQGRRLYSIRKAFRRACDASELGKDVTPYTIRHTMATELRKRGVPQWEVSGMLGHKTGGTSEIYAKFDPDYLGQAARAIDAYFAEFYPVSLQNVVGEKGFEPPAPTSRTYKKSG